MSEKRIAIEEIKKINKMRKSQKINDVCEYIDSLTPEQHKMITKVLIFRDMEVML